MFAALALLLCVPACATQIMVVSDLHYLSPTLYKNSGLFIQALRAGDGKYTHRGEALMEALCREAARLKPDALLVTGDLSFNGEAESHAALVEWFTRIEAEGVPVWVIPGNHDINSPTPRGFTEDGWYEVDGVTAEQFSAIYAEHMLPTSGGANLSYVVQVGENLRAAMVDTSFYQPVGQTFGLFTAGHAQWLKDALEADAEAVWITASHHSLIAHTQFMKDSYLMFGSDSMAELARSYGVRLNLSGHLHVQHIAHGDGLTDAALGAFCVWPHRYALVTLEDGKSLTYEAKALEDADLPEGFLEESRQWFFDIARAKAEASLADVNAEDAALMSDYVARFTLAYFSGSYRSDDPSWRQDPVYALWSAQADDTYWQTMKLIMDEPNGNNLSWP